MQCPHCGQSVEQERYLMARDPKGEMVWPPGAVKVALCVIAVVCLAGLLALARIHGAT